MTVAWRIDQGTIEDVDVTGCTIAAIAHIPGKPLDGNWRAAVYIDDSASEAQEAAVLNVFTGELGGAIADVAKLIGEVVGVELVPITFETKNGTGKLKVGNIAEGHMEVFKTEDGDRLPFGVEDVSRLEGVVVEVIDSGKEIEGVAA